MSAQTTRRRVRITVSFFMFMFGLFPLLNAIDNPRVQTLHGTDFVGLIASGLCFGFGLGLLLGKLMFRGD